MVRPKISRKKWEVVRNITGGFVYIVFPSNMGVNNCCLLQQNDFNSYKGIDCAQFDSPNSYSVMGFVKFLKALPQKEKLNGLAAPQKDKNKNEWEELRVVKKTYL